MDCAGSGELLGHQLHGFYEPLAVSAGVSGTGSDRRDHKTAEAVGIIQGYCLVGGENMNFDEWFEYYRKYCNPELRSYGYTEAKAAWKASAEAERQRCLAACDIETAEWSIEARNAAEEIKQAIWAGDKE